MVKTGRQIFKDQIIDKLDLTITVERVINDDDPNVEFTVCDLKWLRPGMVIRDIDSGNWDIDLIDYDTNRIIGKRPNPEAILRHGSVFTMDAPDFKSGTPSNLNGEIGIDEEAGVFTSFPIVWLLESIKGKGFNRLNSQGKSFDFQWYVLDETKIDDWNNEQRHFNGVLPMSQLGQAIIESIESNSLLKLTNDYDFNEFNFFGRENESGFEKYILKKNLSGVGYRASVSIAKSVCEC